jgi:hypothetical protein
MKTTNEICESAGLRYEFYVDEAKSIVRELEQGRVHQISERYIEEKIRNVKNLFEEIRKEISRQEIIKNTDYEKEQNIKKFSRF